MRYTGRVIHFKSVMPLVVASIVLAGCEPKTEPGQVADKGAATDLPGEEQAAAIPRDRVRFTSRPTSGSTNTGDLFLKLGDKEVKIATGPNNWDEVKPGGSHGVPENALSGARQGYAGGASWYFVAEEDGRYVVKVSDDDEGSPGGEDAVMAHPAKARVMAIFSKTGETILEPSASASW